MGVFVNSGIGAQVVAIPETTYGVAPALTGSTLQPYEFNSETLELKKTVVQGKGIHAGGLHNRAARRVPTNYAAAGGITMDLPTRYLNQWLFQMFGSKGQTLATLTQDATTGAYKAVHAPGSLKGSSLTIQKGVPSVDGSAANPFTYTGVKFLDWTISVATGAIASLVINVDGYNELAGPAVNTPSVPATTVTATNSNAFPVAVTITGGTLTVVSVNGVTVGSTAGTYTVPAAGTIAITYTVAPTWSWSAGSLNGDPLNAAVPALATFTEAASNNVFHFREATILTGGTPSTSGGITTVSGASVAGNVKSAQIKYAFHMDTERFFLGSKGFKAEPIENDFRDITGQFVVEWLNAEAQYVAFAQDSVTTLELDFIGPGIGTGSDLSSLKILIPDIYLEGESPKVGGPQVVTQTVPFTGLDDGTNNPIQAIYWTLDTV